jgi:hypothetical protein
MNEELEALRTASLTVLFVGAVGSVALTLYVGRSNSSHLLIGMFAVWVLSPFALLALIAAGSKSRSSRAMLYGLIIVLSAATLLIYGDVALGPSGGKKALAFLVTPAVSWLLTGIVMAIAAFLSSRR